MRYIILMARPISKGVDAFKVLSAGPLAGPGRDMAAGIRQLAQRSGLSESQARSWVNHALKQGWAAFHTSRDGFKLSLSDQGRTKWQQGQLQAPLAQAEWDNRWRLVMFDIPAKYKPRRDRLRIKLKQLGLVQLQASVWLTPYPCKDHIRLLADLYRVGPYIYVLEARRFDGDHAFLAKFDLL